MAIVNTNFVAPTEMTIENKSANTIKIPVAGSPDMFIIIAAGGTVTVTAKTTAEVAFYDSLQSKLPVNVTA